MEAWFDWGVVGKVSVYDLDIGIGEGLEVMGPFEGGCFSLGNLCIIRSQLVLTFLSIWC